MPMSRTLQSSSIAPCFEGEASGMSAEAFSPLLGSPHDHITNSIALPLLATAGCFFGTSCLGHFNCQLPEKLPGLTHLRYVGKQDFIRLRSGRFCVDLCHCSRL